MATATLLPNLAVEWAGTMANAFQTGRVDALTPEELRAAMSMCAALQDLFASARRSIAERLAQGVDAGAFATDYEQLVVGLKELWSTTERTVTKAGTSPLPPAAEQFVASYRSLTDEIAGLHQFLANAVAKAKQPLGAIDKRRVQEAEAAYARGETKPFRRSAKS
jgi:hypothetical protein